MVISWYVNNINSTYLVVNKNLIYFGYAPVLNSRWIKTTTKRLKQLVGGNVVVVK